MRAEELLAGLALIVASPILIHCKDNSDAEESVDAAVASVAPPPANPIPAATSAAPAAPPATTPPQPTAAPAKPLATARASATPSASASSASAPSADAGAPAGTSKPSGSAAPAAGADKLKACFEKCQGVLQACLTPKLPADGGLPQPADSAGCQSAFDTCRKACAP